MKYLKQFSSFLLFFISYSIFGQEIVVIDLISQFPLEGVAIYNKAKNMSFLGPGLVFLKGSLLLGIGTWPAEFFILLFMGFLIERIFIFLGMLEEILR